MQLNPVGRCFREKSLCEPDSICLARGRELQEFVASIQVHQRHTTQALLSVLLDPLVKLLGKEPI